MGERAQVKVVSQYADNPVYLYTHYDGSNLINIVKKSIIKQKRWNDSEYLARIIFCEMIKEDIEGSTGFGIGTSEHGDIEYLDIVDIPNQRVIHCDLHEGNETVQSFRDIIKEYEIPQNGSILSQKQKDFVKSLSDFNHAQERKRFGIQ